MILLAFVTKPVLIARNSKLACETVALVVQHHKQLSYNTKVVEKIFWRLASVWAADSHCLATSSMGAWSKG